MSLGFLRSSASSLCAGCACMSLILLILALHSRVLLHLASFILLFCLGILSRPPWGPHFAGQCSLCSHLSWWGFHDDSQTMEQKSDGKAREKHISCLSRLKLKTLKWRLKETYNKSRISWKSVLCGGTGWNTNQVQSWYSHLPLYHMASGDAILWFCLHRHDLSEQGLWKKPGIPNKDCRQLAEGGDRSHNYVLALSCVITAV